MGVVPPAPGFLEHLRHVCSDSGALLVFDEVITGFRVALGGYQSVCGVLPDLTCLGKVIGGGMPVGAYGGRREFMELVAPLGPVYQAGTLSGNPIAMAAGLATLRAISQPRFFEALDAKAERLARGLADAALRSETAAQLNRCGSLMTLFFSDAPVIDYASARKADTALFGRYFHAMLEAGVYLPPSQFEAMFVSAAHSDADIDATIAAAEQALAAVRA
jgi:glutamate-1-semialdehyde 2,1-aminomutase